MTAVAQVLKKWPDCEYVVLLSHPLYSSNSNGHNSIHPYYHTNLSIQLITSLMVLTPHFQCLTSKEVLVKFT